MLQALMIKVDSLQEQMDSVSREMETQRKDGKEMLQTNVSNLMYPSSSFNNDHFLLFSFHLFFFLELFKQIIDIILF